MSLSLPLYITADLPITYIRLVGSVRNLACLFVHVFVHMALMLNPRYFWAGAWCHESLSSKTTKVLNRALGSTNVVR
jgi:hypothetical protein